MLTPHDAPQLQAEGLTVTLGGRTVLADVTVTAHTGAIALVGNNGAGKSTLLRAVATLQPATSRSFTVRGMRLDTPRGLRSARRHLGYLPAEADFPRRHTVHEAVTYAAWLRRVPAALRPELVAAALRTVNLQDRSGERLAELSTGLLRRAMLAQALVHRPEIVLLDEPTAAIDPEHRAELRQILRHLAADRLVIFSTHLDDDLRHAADRAIVLDAGTIRWDGPAPDLLALGAHSDRPGDGPLEGALRIVTARAAPLT